MGPPGEAEAAFWDAIADAPTDDVPKLVFADWLDERGDPCAACLRWLVKENKRPAFDRIDTKTWDWWSRRPPAPEHYPDSPHQYTVPRNLFTRLWPYGGGVWKGSATYIQAVLHLRDG